MSESSYVSPLRPRRWEVCFLSDRIARSLGHRAGGYFVVVVDDNEHPWVSPTDADGVAWGESDNPLRGAKGPYVSDVSAHAHARLDYYGTLENPPR